MGRKFRCAACHGDFEVEDPEWTEEAALSELREIFPGVPKEECDVVCDDCFKAMGLGNA